MSADHDDRRTEWLAGTAVSTSGNLRRRRRLAEFAGSSDLPRSYPSVVDAHRVHAGGGANARTIAVVNALARTG
jgi:hypothetical protein